MMVVMGWRDRRMGRYGLMGIEFYRMRRFMGNGGGDSLCNNVIMCLVSLNCILKMVMIKFVICILQHKEI